jgi:hypothetical protein
MNTNTQALASRPAASSHTTKGRNMTTQPTLRTEPELLQYTWPSGHVTLHTNHNPTPSAKFVVMYRVRPSNGTEGIWLDCGKTDDPQDWQARYGHLSPYANSDLHFAPLVPREVTA